MSVSIRSAGPADAALVYAFIRELAAYEDLSDEVAATEADIAAALSGPSPRAFAEIAEQDGAPVGFSLWFYTFSSFVGRCGIWLEDLYVRPDQRGRGTGRALIENLARRCRDERLGRLEWSVLDWNAPSIAFYESLGARPNAGWTVYRTTGEALARLAEGAAD
ncbi:GNAT family N-acetyltransferase [Methylopila musalis]|uniref:GNAT family N-acetyltransferase n=1 Tax=Methylopila musalis TaxID=1134781 RepID=A0ABW3Z5Z4_9HYPH